MPLIKDFREKYTYSFVRALNALREEQQLNGDKIVEKKEYQGALLSFKKKNSAKAWLDLLQRYRIHDDSTQLKMAFLKHVMAKTGAGAPPSNKPPQKKKKNLFPFPA